MASEKTKVSKRSNASSRKDNSRKTTPQDPVLSGSDEEDDSVPAENNSGFIGTPIQDERVFVLDINTSVHDAAQLGLVEEVPPPEHIETRELLFKDTDNFSAYDLVQRWFKDVKHKNGVNFRVIDGGGTFQSVIKLLDYATALEKQSELTKLASQESEFMECVNVLGYPLLEHCRKYSVKYDCTHSKPTTKPAPIVPTNKSLNSNNKVCMGRVVAQYFSYGDVKDSPFAIVTVWPVHNHAIKRNNRHALEAGFWSIPDPMADSIKAMLLEGLTSNDISNTLIETAESVQNETLQSCSPQNLLQWISNFRKSMRSKPMGEVDSECVRNYVQKNARGFVRYCSSTHPAPFSVILMGDMQESLMFSLLSDNNTIGVYSFNDDSLYNSLKMTILVCFRGNSEGVRSTQYVGVPIAYMIHEEIDNNLEFYQKFFEIVISDVNLRKMVRFAWMDDNVYLRNAIQHVVLGVRCLISDTFLKHSWKLVLDTLKLTNSRRRVLWELSEQLIRCRNHNPVVYLDAMRSAGATSDEADQILMYVDCIERNYFGRTSDWISSPASGPVQLRDQLSVVAKDLSKHVLGKSWYPLHIVLKRLERYACPDLQAFEKSISYTGSENGDTLRENVPLTEIELGRGQNNSKRKFTEAFTQSKQQKKSSTYSFDMSWPKVPSTNLSVEETLYRPAQSLNEFGNQTAASLWSQEQVYSVQED
jgi:hypothetical protein